jgi:methionyl-tRNA formyltransferase
VLETPRLGCVNVHASLLPRWRGAAPVQRAIAAGDDATGVCIMQMDAGLDTGPILLTRTLPIAATDNAQTLSDKLAAQGAEALLAALPGLATGQLAAVPQPATGKTYARRLHKSEAWIDWQQPADHILCQIRAFNPWPVAQTRWQQQTLRIWQAQPSPPAVGSVPAAGTVLQADAAGIVVATGAGTIRITQLQLPGKKAVSAADFVNAYDIVRATLS